MIFSLPWIFTPAQWVEDGWRSIVVKDGDIISIDIPNSKLELKISDEELAARMAAFVPKKKELSGYLKRYAALVSSGAKGAILNV